MQRLHILVTQPTKKRTGILNLKLNGVAQFIFRFCLCRSSAAENVSSVGGGIAKLNVIRGTFYYISNINKKQILTKIILRIIVNEFYNIVFIPANILQSAQK